MKSSEIEQRILAILEDAEMEVLGEDCDFTVTVISEGFEGLLPMKRQQLVLTQFSDELRSGKLHALTVKAYTLAEWNNKSSGLIQLSI